VDYVIADTHFDHGNIIEYCDRPFESVEEMNDRLVENWNRVVDPTDEVLFVGDLTIAGTASAFLTWISELNGEIVFVVGDHDTEVLTTLDDVSVCEYFRTEHDGHDFYAVHDPAEAPRNWGQWLLHGHHHNNWPGKFPFVNHRGGVVNVSVELIGYEPLAFDALVRYLERGEWIPSIDAVDSGDEPADGVDDQPTSGAGDDASNGSTT
jgi:calcineurin-like phosphoesterase family protein